MYANEITNMNKVQMLDITTSYSLTRRTYKNSRCDLQWNIILFQHLNILGKCAFTKFVTNCEIEPNPSDP